MKTLETNRLILRDFCLTDLADFNEYAVMPEVGLNAGWKPHESLEESLFYLGKFVSEQNVWAIYHKVDKKVIGSVGLHTESYPEYISLGYVLSKNYWGQGLTVEAVRTVLGYAFFDLNLPILGVSHYTHNHRSKRVIEKLGFAYEGTLRKYRKIFNGDIYDLSHYSMTREEFLTLKC